MIGKLPMVYMRQRGLTYDQAMEITLGIVSNIGNLDDDEKIDKIKAMLLTRIDLGE
jgi:Fe-S cluster assembly scaffold protein SufB